VTDGRDDTAEHDDGRWRELGFADEETSQWKALGLGPFEAAVARLDGLTPATARHHRHLLRATAARWAAADLDNPEGLRWHQAGFTARDAAALRASGVDLEAVARGCWLENQHLVPQPTRQD